MSDHDRASEFVDPNVLSAALDANGSDPLSDVLRTIKLDGALFFLVDASDPWCVDVPAARTFSELILPTARHVVSYHIAVEGEGLASVPGDRPIRFSAGDIVVFPHGDPYLMTSAPGVEPELNTDETLQFFRALAAGQLPYVIPEGGGGLPKAKFICGFLGCDLYPYNPLFSALPRCLHVTRPPTAGRDLLDNLVDLAVSQSQTDLPGARSIRLGLSELMFVEVLRRQMLSRSLEQTGWLAGLRDPVVGRCLASIHADPARQWTLQALADVAGTSRSVLSERFTTSLGQTPIRYLSNWRMQLAARLLADGDKKVSTIACDVGFGSEAAFSRAFKSTMGCPPSEWRSGKKRH